MTPCDCSFVEILLGWWRNTRRPHLYPWRLEKDPYRVLIAEILLQRTRRDKVVEVYEAFVRRYPRPEDLAHADEDEVRELIRPLGLEKRAPYMIRLAHALLERRHVLRSGRFEELPGVGPYIASAARTILGMPTRLIPDASIARVLSRLYGRPLNARRPADTPWVHECLNLCAPRDPDQRRDYFLALIDLAWEVCKPTRPRCGACPLKGMCTYYRGRSGKPSGTGQHA